MFRILVPLMVVAALAAPALGDPIPVDSTGEIILVDPIGENAFNKVPNDNDNVVAGGEGVATSTPLSNYGARADRDGAAANNGSSAFVDNSIFAKDSSLSRTDLKGEITGNAVHMKDSHFVGVNRIDDDSFHDARGVSQVSQNSGQNSLIQQSFTIESNLKVDHSSP